MINKVNTLAIEVGIETEYEDALIASAKKAGWEVRVVRHVPFSHEFEGAGEDLLQNKENEQCQNGSYMLSSALMIHCTVESQRT